MAPTWGVTELGTPILIRAVCTVLLSITHILLGHTLSAITAERMRARTEQVGDWGQGVCRAGQEWWGRWPYPCRAGWALGGSSCP